MKIDLSEIFQPITRELKLVELELLKQVKYNENFSNEITKYFFKTHGKYLRPALVFLSAKINLSNQTESMVIKNSPLIYTAVAIELIHSATLIHDDIVDNSMERRDHTSLNKLFDNKIAVLAGDVLFARALSILTEKLDKKILIILIKYIENMTRGELNELIKPVNSFDEYLEIIKDKTAGFMSVSCQVGAMLSNYSETIIEALGKFGLNFGISYQIIDDYIDGDIPFAFKINMLEKANYYASLAKDNIKIFNDSKYKKSLQNLVDYIITSFVNNRNRDLNQKLLIG